MVFVNRKPYAYFVANFPVNIVQVKMVETDAMLAMKLSRAISTIKGNSDKTNKNKERKATVTYVLRKYVLV